VLQIETIYKKGILFVRCYGVINKETKKELEKTLESAINEVGIKYLLLNVENIYYINTEIESIIKKWSTILSKKDGKFFMCGKEQLKETYDVDKTEKVLQMTDEFSVFKMINI